MRRLIIVLVPVVIIALTAFTLIPELMPSTDRAPEKKSCSGYEVIEANKGIDCNGDTIRLIKKHGFYEIAANQ